MSEPVARRLRPDWMSRGDLLDWSWARKRLEAERNYWVCTVQESGRPHSRPVWGLWLDDVLYLSIGEAGFRHAVRSPDGSYQVSVHVDSAEDVVIMDGAASRIEDAEVRHKVSAAYNEKYAPGYGNEVANFVFVPRVAYGWESKWDGETHGTHWTFEAG